MTSDPTREAIIEGLARAIDWIKPEPGMDGPHGGHIGGVTRQRAVAAIEAALEYLAALSATPAPLDLLAEWALDDPWEKGDHVLDSEEDFFCVGCGTRAPFTYDRDQPDWWKQTPNPQIGHDADCLWVRSRAALEGAPHE